MISLQISKDLQDDLDQIQDKGNYASRSECLRGMIVEYIRNHTEQLSDKHRIALLTVHHEIREDIASKYADIMAHSEEIIKSVSQYHLKNRIIKIILVSGFGIEINELYQQFEADRLYKCTITYLIIPEKKEKVVHEEVEQKEFKKEK
ncbi:MAG: CopG family ribbon-helix-helix protein [Promethearchaeota archaeon]